MLLTAPTASGTGQLATLHDLQIDGAYFPDIRKGKRLATIALKDFSMVFPIPVAL
jgi:hypothetical protein